MASKKGGKQKRIAGALGASRVIHLSDRKTGDPLTWLKMAYAVQTRLVSRGGRPSDPDWDTKRLVPFRRQTWKHLAREAKVISSQGRKVGPAQLAAIMIEESLTPTTVVITAQKVQVHLAKSGFEIRQSFDNAGAKPKIEPLTLSSTPAYPPIVESGAQHPWSAKDAPPGLMRSASIGV